MLNSTKPCHAACSWTLARAHMGSNTGLVGLCVPYGSHVGMLPEKPESVISREICFCFSGNLYLEFPTAALYQLHKCLQKIAAQIFDTQKQITMLRSQWSWSTGEDGYKDDHDERKQKKPKNNKGRTSKACNQTQRNTHSSTLYIPTCRGLLWRSGTGLAVFAALLSPSSLGPWPLSVFDPSPEWMLSTSLSFNALISRLTFR